MIAGIIGFIGSMKTWPWRAIGCIALALAILGALYFFGRYLYALGVSDERAAWEARVEALEDGAADLGARAGSDFQQDVNDLGRRLEIGATEIGASDDLETLFAAWARADQRLCDGDACGDRRA